MISTRSHVLMGARRSTCNRRFTASFRAELGVKLMSGKDYWRRWVRRLGGGPWEQYRFYQDTVVVEGFSTPDEGSKSPRKKGKTKAPPESVARVQGVLPGDIVDKVDKYKLQGQFADGPRALPLRLCCQCLCKPFARNKIVICTQASNSETS